MKKIIPFLILAFFCVSVIAQDIAQWRGPNRDGIYKETGLLKKWPDSGPKLLWHFDELGDGHSSAAVTSHAIYTAGMINGNGYIYALDLAGKLLWKKEYGIEWTENWNGTRSTPLVYKDKLYLMSAFGKLVCLQTSNGELKWTVDILKDYDGRNIQWGLTENLLIDDNKLYVTPGGETANIIALDINSGKLIWKSKGNSQKSGYCSPIVINLPKRKIIVTQMEKSIMAVDASNGAFLWKHEQTNDWAVHPNVPIYNNGYLYCTSGYGRGGVMLKLSEDGSSITEAWRDPNLDPKIGGVVLLNGRIYGSGDKNRKLFCIDWKTGKEIYSTSNMAPGNLIFADGLIYAYSEAGNVAILEPGENSFNVISSFKVPFGANQHWSHLVINNKKLYVRHGTSLMVYDIASR
jgi:outer membrane protein assembly factor BamB